MARKSAMKEREAPVEKESSESIESTLEKIRQEITVASKAQKPEAYLLRIEKAQNEEVPKDFPRIHLAVEKEIRAAMKKLEKEARG